MDTPQTNPQGQNQQGDLSSKNTMPQAPQVGNPQSASPIGPIVGVIIIVLVLALGGLYFWGKELAQQDSLESTNDIVNTPDSSTESLKSQGSSDELSSIETDISATNFSDLDKELRDIDAEAQAEAQ